MADPQQIDGLPAGATLRPIQGLPPGAELRPISVASDPVASTSTPKPGFVSNFLDSSGISALGHAVVHPYKTIAPVLGIANDMVHGRPASDTNPITQAVQGLASEGKQAYQDAKSGNYAGALTHGISAIPGGGALIKTAQDAPVSTGNYLTDLKNVATDPSTMGSLVGMAASPVLAEGAGKLVKAIPSAIRAPLTSGLDETIAGTTITPRDRFDAAKRLGVNLDVADATNSSPAKMVKAVGENSLLGSGVYEKAKAANIAALGDATDSTLNSMSPLDREAGGVRLQSLLKDNQQALKSQADNLYGSVDTRYGNTPLKNPATLNSVADAITSGEAQHAAEFPSLVPGKVGSVVSDASRFGKPIVEAPKMSGLLDESGAPIPSSVAPAIPIAPTVSTALKARSGILDMYANNPDLVKSASDAQLQKLVGATHDSIMESLPPEAGNDLRNAQLTYKEMKDVYDNPSSPLYDAVRTPNPSSKVTGIGPQTPESVRGIIGRVGDEGQGILQRGNAEKLLGTAPGADQYNFRSFPQQLSKLPADYASELYSPEHLSSLQDISSTSQALAKDLNPSGSGKLTQKILEGSALASGIVHPLAAVPPLLQYPAAKLMNSPTVVNWLMEHPQTVQAPVLKFPAIAAPALANGTRRQ